MTSTDAPSPAPQLWPAIAAIFCVLLVAFQLADVPSGTAISKLLASTAFVATALVAGASHSRYGRSILAGLLFSWLGDAFLLGSGQPTFLLGLVSFLLAHCAYIAAFLIIGTNHKWTVTALIPIAAASTAVSLWLQPYLSSEMLWPVRIYTIVISVMVVTAIGARGAGASLLIPVGALLFYCSDLSVAAGQFVQPEFPNYVWGLPFYYAGQLLLAISTARFRPGPSGADIE